MSAARSGHADCVRLLADVGADTEVKNNVRARVDLWCEPSSVGWGGVLMSGSFVRQHAMCMFFRVFSSSTYSVIDLRRIESPWP